MPLTPLLHDLALLFLALTHGADGELDGAEQEAMREQLISWAPGMDPNRIEHVLREATMSYANGLGPERLEVLLGRLQKNLDYDARQRVLADLRTLAQADDEVVHAELRFIDRVEAAWTV
jgi:uncharacterized tellurite resistance protein B-like protein